MWNLSQWLADDIQKLLLPGTKCQEQSSCLETTHTERLYDREIW